MIVCGRCGSRELRTAAYVHLGPKGCEQRYRAHRDTINRWLDECGREKLIEARRKYLTPAVYRDEMGFFHRKGER